MSKFKLPVMYRELHWRDRREVRNQYVREQERKCFHCGCSLDEEPPAHITNKPIKWKLFPENFLKYPVHLQHCHKTGLTEGAVHSYCNAVMWQYEGR